MNSEGELERFTLKLHEGLGNIAAKDWDHLGGNDDPFLSHAFLRTLETTDCLEPYGWFPRHLVIHDELGRPVAATPLYVKTNSYGEFVFDWSWASAFERADLAYYPKLVSAIPYTPVTGPRLLIAPKIPAAEKHLLRKFLIQETIALAQKNDMSGMHWLFTDETDTALLDQQGLMLRLGCQYHWRNRGYFDFDSFLAALSSNKRKKIKRERRRIAEAGIHMKIFHGDEADKSVLDSFYEFYVATFERHMGIPTLSREFFYTAAHSLGRRFMLVMAEYENQWVAGAVNFLSDTTLYGRYWGCRDTFHSLHFETCYYQGIEHCISKGLSRFEPGAQGEHKISRGFLPTPTWSAHWISNDFMRPRLEAFCRHEQQMMRAQCKSLQSHSPYKSSFEDQQSNDGIDSLA